MEPKFAFTGNAMLFPFHNIFTKSATFFSGITFKISLLASFFLLVSFVSSTCFAQNIKPLIHGDKVPDLVFTQLVNTSDSSLKLSDYKGKAVILDFWSLACSSCIKHMPHTDSLQGRFNDKLKIILVDSRVYRDKPEQISKTLRRLDQPGHKFTMPSIINDTVLDKLFPHYGTPFYVWIDKDGIYRSSTSGEFLEDNYITDFIENGKSPAFEKKDIPHSRPMYTTDDLPLNRLVHFGILVKGLSDGGNGGGPRFISDSVRGTIQHNRSLYAMFEWVFNQKIKADFDQQVILETKHPDWLDYRFADKEISYPQWRRYNYYSYELVVPSGEIPKIGGYMLDDLNKYSPFIAHFEKRKEVCWVIEKSGDTGQLISKGGEFLFSLDDPQHIHLQDVPLSGLIQYVRSHNPGTIILNQSGIDGPVDMKLHGDIRDIPHLAQELKRYNLSMTKQTVLLDMMIICDK